MKNPVMRVLRVMLLMLLPVVVVLCLLQTPPDVWLASLTIILTCLVLFL